MIREYEKLPATIAQVEKENGIITLKAVYKNAGAFTVSPVKDPQRPGFYLGVEKLAEDEKKGKKYYVNPEKLTIKIVDGKTFNLADEVDATNWAWVKFIPEIVMSFEDAQRSSYETRYFVQIEEVESRKTVKRLSLKSEAFDLIKADDPTNYSSRVRLLGLDMRGQKAITQKEYLMEEADRNPGRVIEVYNSDTVGVRLLMLNALDKGVIDYDLRIYSYNHTTLGMSEEAVIEFLTRAINKPIYDLIQGDLNYITNPDLKLEDDMVAEVAEVEVMAESVPRPRGGK